MCIKNNNLEHINLPQLNWVASINVQDSDSIVTSQHLPRFTRFWTLPKLHNNEALQDIDLPELQTANPSSQQRIQQRCSSKYQLAKTTNGSSLTSTIEVQRSALQNINLPKLQTVCNFDTLIVFGNDTCCLC